MSSSPADLSGVTLLISHDRSGSHFLGSFIRKLSGQTMIDEVCNEQAIDPVADPRSFFGFRYKLGQENADYLLRRNVDLISDLLEKYFSFLLGQADGKGVVVDIKYGHIHNFELAWWPIFRKPYLFDFVASRKMKIIHLSRWNSLETVVSGFVAESRKVWHAVGDAPTADASDAIDVDKGRMIEQVTWLNQQKEAISKWAQGASALPVLYEELVDPKLGEQCRRRIASFLGDEPPKDFVSIYKKVTPEMKTVVRNWNEVRRACLNNGLAQYLVPLRS